MKLIISPLTWVVLLSMMITSCLPSDEEDGLVANNDAAMATFALGGLKCIQHTTTSSGADSVYATTIAGSQYKMYIDQLQGLIYNADSLPCGTDVSKVVVSATSKNGGTIGIKNTEDDKVETFVTTDSIDFTQPRKFIVTSQDGTYKRVYTVMLNVHKEQADSFQWKKMGVAAQLSSLKGMKMVVAANRIWVLGSDGIQTQVYCTSATQPDNWETKGTFSADAYKNLVVCHNKPFILDNGTLWKIDANDTSWEIAEYSSNGACPMKQLVGSDGVKVFGVDESGKLYASNGAENSCNDFTEEELGGEEAAFFPTDDFNGVPLPVSTNNEFTRLVVIGNRSIDQYPSDATAMVWQKLSDYGDFAENQPWQCLSEEARTSFQLPRLTNLTAFQYDGGMLAFGGDGIGGSTHKAFGNLYVSVDGGLSWQTEKRFSLPEDFASSKTVFAATSDSQHYIWIICGDNGQIWRGRLNRLGWKQNPKTFTE